jgi:hypothetical protein
MTAACLGRVEMAGEQFFTLDSLATLAGATGATLVVTNTAKQAFGFAQRWFGLLVAEVVCIGLAIWAHRTGSDYVIAMLNGCLVFLGAAGASDGASPGSRGNATSRGSAAEEVHTWWNRFFGTWF